MFNVKHWLFEIWDVINARTLRKSCPYLGILKFCFTTWHFQTVMTWNKAKVSIDRQSLLRCCSRPPGRRKFCFASNIFKILALWMAQKHACIINSYFYSYCCYRLDLLNVFVSAGIHRKNPKMLCEKLTKTESRSDPRQFQLRNHRLPVEEFILEQLHTYATVEKNTWPAELGNTTSWYDWLTPQLIHKPAPRWNNINEVNGKNQVITWTGMRKSKKSCLTTSPSSFTNEDWLILESSLKKFHFSRSDCSRTPRMFAPAYAEMVQDLLRITLHQLY